MLTNPADPILFYESREGRAAKEILRFHVEKLWGKTPIGQRVLALGAGGMLCDGTASAARLSAARGETYPYFVDSRNKPLPDDDFDRLVALHACPEGTDIGALMIEARRVLKGEGRLLLILPRLHSRWTRAQTPFASERGYTARQISKMLADRGLHLRNMKRALYVNPRTAASGVRTARLLERLAPGMLMPWSGGVWIVEAEKRVCAMARSGRRAGRSILMPVSLPQMTYKTLQQALK